jgi:predicted AAA+ superfamily ATPase
MIKNIILQQKEERDNLLGKSYVNRINPVDYNNYLSTGLVKLISGSRRAGKSVLALQILKNENFAYLNFDDDLLLKNFEEDAVTKLLNEIYNGYKYVLLDEIQNLPGWELWVNKLCRRGINLFITGSNARLLSNEMATFLTGRYLQINVFPFSFAEHLKSNGITIDDNPGQAKTGEILFALNHYISFGGFPEVVLNPEIHKNYLSSLFDSILLKDILKRFKIRQTQQFYDLANYLLTNYTNLYSSNQIKDDLHFNSVNTVQKFIGYLGEPHLFYNLTRYNTKRKLQLKSNKKIYVIDNGFIRAKSFELSPNYGRLLENVVFVELLRREYKSELELFYYRTRNNKEVDFLIRKGHQTEMLIQVCYDLSGTKTLKRETDALTEASNETNCKNLLIISWDEEKVIEKNDCRITITPCYKWLTTYK